MKQMTNNALFLLVVAMAMTACKKDQSVAYTRGEAEVVTVEGVRQLIARDVAADAGTILSAGFSGIGAQGRVIWSQRDGSVLLDESYEEIVEPSQVATCVSGQMGQVAFAVESEGRTRIRRVALNEANGTVTARREWVDLGTSPQLGAIDGDGAVCGLCIHDPDGGQLHCQTSNDNPDPTSWETGALARWSVHQSGESLALIDWGLDGDRWMTVRIAALTDGPFEWAHGYIIGKRPEIPLSGNEINSNPRFSFTGEEVVVGFVDDTEYFPHIYIQRFPLAGGEPTDPLRIDDCRQTCESRWFGIAGDAHWFWYNSGIYDIAVYMPLGGDSRGEVRFDAQQSVLPIDDGLFKMGLGNQLGNWWAVFVQEAD